MSVMANQFRAPRVITTKANANFACNITCSTSLITYLSSLQMLANVAKKNKTKIGLNWGLDDIKMLIFLY